MRPGQAQTDDALSLIRLTLANPEIASAVLGVHLKLVPSERNNERRLLHDLWDRTDNFAADIVTPLQKHLQGRHDIQQPDVVTSRLIDDYVLGIANSISTTLHDYLLSHYQVPDSLPLVDELLHRKQMQKPLVGYVLVACQHILGTTVSQLKYLNQLGIAWNDMHIVGKPYSTSRPALLYLQRYGANVHPFSQHVVTAGAKNSVWFENALQQAAAKLLDDAVQSLRSRGGQILILDDGGMVLEAANSRDDVTSDKIVGVEQTTGGINRLRNTTLHFGVVDVASSHAKLSLEAEHIARSIIDESLLRIGRIRGSNASSSEKYLVVGFGPVGAWVAALLRRAYGEHSLCIYDIDTRRAAVARAVGFETATDINSALRRASCIIGCTGHRAFDTARDNAVRPDTILVSGSSANFEFDGVASRSRDRFTNLGESPLHYVARSDFARIHDDYRSTNALGTFWLCNAGFPVNLSGEFDPIEARHIQITRALMIAGAVQAAVGSREVGLRKFSPEFDACISEVFGTMIHNDNE